MKFNNGKLKILILADIHAAREEMKWTRNHIEGVLDKTKPDLVVLLGDNVTGCFPGVSVGKVKNTINEIGSIFESRSIPFALVFGNHDHEGLCSLGFDERSAKKFIMNEFKKFSCCLAEEGEEMTGVGNYNIPVLSTEGDKIKFNLWFVDSNPYADESEGGGYGYVHDDQTEWYEETAERLKEENGGENVPSFVFQHIIVPEIYDMFRFHSKWIKGSVKGHGRFSDGFYTMNEKFIYSGNLREGPCPPDIKSEQFDSWIKRGDVLAAFFGHDHINDFSGTYRGINIHQVPSAGFYSYGYTQGSRVITLYENDIENYDTRVVPYKEVSDVKIRNPFVKKHGYHRWLTQFLPVTAAVTAGTVAGAAIKICAGMIKKKKRV